MTGFDERENAFEAKYAHDAETQFRVVARRNKLAGRWAAGLLQLDDVEAYAKTVVEADFEEVGDADVIRKLLGDLQKGGVETSEAAIREKLATLLVEAREQIAAG